MSSALLIFSSGRLLLIEFVAASGTGHKVESSISRKDKRKLPIPVRPFLDAERNKHAHCVGIVLLLEISTNQGTFNPSSSFLCDSNIWLLAIFYVYPQGNIELLVSSFDIHGLFLVVGPAVCHNQAACVAFLLNV